MPISLSKGGNLSLSKEAPGLSNLLVGLGWDARSTDGQPFDLDASALMLTAEGKVRSNSDFIFYGQTASADGSVSISGDNRTGQGAGDDETVNIDLSKVPADIVRMPICVTIHEAEARRQNFGMVRQAYVRIVDKGTDREVARFDLSEDASLDTAIIFAEVYRHNADWKFKAIGQGFAGGLGPLANSFGVEI